MQCPLPRGTTGVPHFGRREALSLSQGNTTEQGWPFPVRNPTTCMLCGSKQGGQTLCCAILFNPKSVCWLLQASHSLFPSELHFYITPSLFGSQDALLLCKAVPRQSQDKGAAHSFLCPTSGTTLPLIHKALAGQPKATETGKCSQGHN